MSPTATHFGLLDPLPTGRLAIQASAGTGKTFTLAALATRFIAERDVPTSELLIVTFTRAATSELRARVRDRLVSAVAHLSSDEPSDDELLTHLAATDRELRLARLERAVTEFDAATITTIHGFATQVLATLGVTAGADPDAVLVDDSAPLAAECCADVLAAAALEHDLAELPDFEKLVRHTRTAINIADLKLLPAPDDASADASSRLLVRLVRRSIEEMRARRRDAGTLSFDDVLVELRNALRGPDGGGGGSAAAIETLRSRYRVALIDEFQDTDPVQWDIFRSIFSSEVDPESTLVLVGDPKQAIYAFRGANVHTYLDAVGDSSGAQRRSLGTNWRSDGAAVDATTALLGGTTYGDDRIAFTEVNAAPQHQQRRMLGADGAPLAPIELRLALGEDFTRGQRKPNELLVPEVRPAIFADLVERVRAMLDGATLPTDDGQSRAVRPSDVAVLVKSNVDAERVQEALKAQGVPAVLSRGGSVLESVAAEQWRWLLDAMLRPSDPVRARTFALSWFGGHDVDWIVAASDEQLAELQDQLHDWVAVLTERGFNEFQRRLWSATEIAARVLARPDGDRELTDLEHVAELLGAGAPGDRLSVAGLLSVLDAPAPIQIEADIDRDQAARRVESDAQAVQIMTVWVAKGLEFPIVCVPTMWSHRSGDPIFPDDRTGTRCYDLSRGAPWPDKAAARHRAELAEAEVTGENLRLLYVAFTRAQHRTIVWWSRVKGCNRSALARVLFARDQDGHIDPEHFTASKVELPADDECEQQLQPLLDRAGGLITATVHGMATAPADRWSDQSRAPRHEPLELATLDRRLDRTRRRWSFTAITAAEHARGTDPYDSSVADAGAGDEQVPSDEPPEGRDEVIDGAPPGAPTGPQDPAAAAGLAMLPAGASFGTLVHSVLEEVDFAAADLDEQLRAQVTRQLEWRSFDLTPVGVEGATAADGVDRLVDGLRLAIHTPLGALLGGASLAQVERTDRLDEMSFDFRLGDGPRRVSDADVGRLVEAHLTPADLFDRQPLHDWAQGLLDGRFGASLAGHLTGSIDLVARTRDADGESRFVVIDYKTNRLSPYGQVPGPGDYGPKAMVEAMSAHHYPLQALLYSVAMHRYLRWRLPGYDPARHLGGVGYLFLRGMVGPDTAVTDGVRHGVFDWAVPPALVVELSDLLDGRFEQAAAT